ncbi:quinic acid utilization activator [Diaporthe amygdali]|uniref:quinic acid utilization activator n=1 Tax=Phomopsis amygdali TaxID=1214568 RepID=UPI0022FDF4B5|nr:quinic acid utilization activator [Diaporthe amygdali]KAJ0122539.1 quinic acid utilization activator [Diaporthe amygdali]
MPPKRKQTTTTSTTSEADNAPSATASPANSNTNSARDAPVKRQRVSRACDQCRAAREKCDGIQPLCFPCVSQNRACTYEANPKKRGVQTGYIKTLEVALAWLFDKVPGCEESLENLLMHEGGQGQSLLVGKDSEKSNRLHKRWRRSKVHRGIDRILSGGEVSQPRPESDDGDSDAEQANKASILTHSQTPSAGPEPPSARSDGLIVADVSGTLFLPPNHWRLLDIYFSYTHCWFPILEKQDLLKTVYLYSAEGIDVQRTSPASAAHAELWAAMALASYQNVSSAKLSAHSNSVDAKYSPDKLYNIARSLVPSEEGQFEIQHARALLLLALISVGKGQKTCAWILVGLAHRIALDVSEAHLGDERFSRRVTATLMGCYILDTLIFVHRRGMPSLETAGILEGMSIPEDNLDEWQPWAPCDGFGQGFSGPATLSRSPAYSLTTFNQLYDVFKFLRKRSLHRQNGRALETPAEVTILLHQTIKPRLPFGNFIVARDSSSATIPSAYVLRVLFLWVSALLNSAESPCALILESIEQYLAQFGPCGTPPFFATCLAMLSQHRSFAELQTPSRERWQSIRIMLTMIWTPAGNRFSSEPRPGSAVSNTAGASNASMGSTSMHTSKSIPTATTTGFIPTNRLQTPTLAAKQRPPGASPFMMGQFSPSTQPALNPAASPQVNNASINMMDTNPIIHGGPGPRAMGQHSHANPGAVHRESFGGGSLDYDAILDDLSSMDYIDRVDADPQFMANLGFAPGCDISEVLNREFGAI